MKAIWCALLAVLLAACSGSDPQVDAEAEAAELMRLSREWSEVAGSGDMEAMMAHWAEDAIMMPPGQPPLRGKEAIRQFVETMGSMPGFSVKWEPLEAHVAPSGDFAYLIEHNQFTYLDSTGAQVTESNKVLTVWRKDPDGSWKNVVDMWNADPTAGATWSSRKASAGQEVGVTAGHSGTPIAYEVVSRGSPTLVFVHGWMCDRTFWRFQRDEFADRGGVVLIDLGGHGESGSDRTEWSIASFAEDVVAVLEALDLHDVILVGHSMGGPVIAEAASRAEDRVLGIVGVDTYKYVGAPWLNGSGVADLLAPLDRDYRAAATEWVRGMFTGEADPALVRHVLDAMLAGSPSVGKPAVRSLFEWNRDQGVSVLKGLTIPVVTINSAVFVETDTELLASLVPNLQVRIMDGAGHFLMLEAPAEFNTLLAEAIALIGSQRMKFQPTSTAKLADTPFEQVVMR